MDVFTIESNLGKGAQHIVGKLANGLLIKYPHNKGLLWDRSTSETAQKDLAIHRNWENPIPETEVLDQPTIDNGAEIVKPPYALLTEEVRGRVFRELDLQKSVVRDQVAELLKKSNTGS